jgi:hypothetical protein
MPDAGCRVPDAGCRVPVLVLGAPGLDSETWDFHSLVRRSSPSTGPTPS